MAVFRVERNKGYSVMSNHLRHKELTLKAKGLLLQMLSLPEDWNYTLKEISEILRKETIDSFNTSQTRRRELSHRMNYQKLGKELMTQNEMAVMDGGQVYFTGGRDPPVLFG